MSRKFLTAIDLTKNELLNPAFQVLGAAPSSPVKGQFYFDDSGKTLAYWDGTAWQTAKSGTGGPPTGAAGGGLTGTYPNPTLAANSVVNATITDASVSASKILDANVTAVKLATDSVTTPKIMDFNVTTSKLATDAVIAGKIANNAVTEPKLAPGIIPGGQTYAGGTGTALPFNLALRAVGMGTFDGLAMPGNAALNDIAVATPTSSPLPMNNQRITGLATPTALADAATKSYVDSVAQGLDAKQSVRLASSANVGGGQAPGTNLTVDGVATVQGDRILLKNQSSPEYNGIYTVNAVSTWNRAPDADTWNELPGAYVWVEEGATNADTGWVCTNNTGGTLGTTAINWALFAAAGSGMTQAQADTRYWNSDGDMSLTGSYQIDGSGTFGIPGGVIVANQLHTFNSISTDGSLSVSGASSVVDFTAASQPVKLPSAAPTLATHATTKGYVDNLVGSGLKKVAGAVAAATSTVVNHAFNTRNVQVQVYRSAAPYDEVECDVERTDVNNVTVRFAIAPAAGEYQIVVIG